MLKITKFQESVNRRFLAAIGDLARVRKLQANTPGVQFNTRIDALRENVPYGRCASPSDLDTLVA